MSNPILGREYEDQEVLVIDLYKRIYDQQTNIDKGFLVIFAGKNSLYGITIATLPNVEDVPVSIIQPVSTGRTCVYTVERGLGGEGGLCST